MFLKQPTPQKSHSGGAGRDPHQPCLAALTSILCWEKLGWRPRRQRRRPQQPTRMRPGPRGHRCFRGQKGSAEAGVPAPRRSAHLQDSYGGTESLAHPPEPRVCVRPEVLRPALRSEDAGGSPDDSRAPGQVQPLPQSPSFQCPEMGAAMKDSRPPACLTGPGRPTPRGGCLRFGDAKARYGIHGKGPSTRGGTGIARARASCRPAPELEISP